MHFNNSIGIYYSYYETLFMNYLHFPNSYKNALYSNKINHFFLGYPIFYKKIDYFKLSVRPIKKKKMKSEINLNQSILFQGGVSRSKLFVYVPVNSFICSIS